MATLTIDTNQESKSSLRAIANFMRELAGDTVATPSIIIVDDTDDTPKPNELSPDEKATLMAGEPAHVREDGVVVRNDPTSLGEVLNPGDALTADPDGAVAPPTAELDSSGRAWDERIDSSSKKTNANGTWKARRGVSKELIEQVKAELAGPAVTPAGSAFETPAPAGSMAAAAGQPTPEMAAAFGSAGVAPGLDPNAQAANQQQETPAQLQPDHTVVTWPDLLGRISKAQSTGTLNQTKVNEFLLANDVKGGIPLLANRSDLFAAFLEYLGL